MAFRPFHDLIYAGLFHRGSLAPRFHCRQFHCLASPATLERAGQRRMKQSRFIESARKLFFEDAAAGARFHHLRSQIQDANGRLFGIYASRVNVRDQISIGIRVRCAWAICHVG